VLKKEADKQSESRYV